MNTKSLIAVIVAFAIGVGLGWFLCSHGPEHNHDMADDHGTVCTLDAKLCPDGSYVGRVGPKCEFAACPSH